MVLKSKVKLMNKYYVYQLIDPRNGSIFYVGKGKGNRIKQHVKDVKAEKIDNAAKHRCIISIMADGLEIIEQKIKIGLTEWDALQLEEKMIREMKETLTNISNGVKIEPGESVKLEAEIMLKDLPPYELWVKYGRPEMLEAYRNVCGSTRVMYDLIRGTLQEVMDG